MVLSVDDKTKPATLSLSIASSADNPKCDVSWGDETPNDDVKIEDNPTIVKHDYSSVSTMSYIHI